MSPQPMARSASLATALVLLALPLPASAATTWIVIDPTDDVPAVAGRCPGSSCRLRDALAAAGNGDTITFAGDMAIQLPLYPMQISNKTGLTIDGTGHTVSLNGQVATCISPNCWELLDVSISAVAFKHLTFRNGGDNTPSPGKPFRDVGAIAITSGSTVTIDDCTFSGNAGVRGGAIANNGTLTVTNSLFDGNILYTSGGSIENSGTLTVINSVFQNGHYSQAAQSLPLRGGAINNTSTGTLTATGCMFLGNSVTAEGGGICNAGNATITGCLIGGNSANKGGGICNERTLLVTNSTFISNGAWDSGGAVLQRGGQAYLVNNTFAGNGHEGVASGISSDGYALFQLFANNIIANGCMFTAVTSSNNLSDDLDCATYSRLRNLGADAAIM